MSHCIKKLWAGNTALFLMLAFGPLPPIMMLALGFSELVFNWVVLWCESVLQPRVGAEWVLLGLSVLSLWHLCGVSALQVEAGRMKGDLVFFCSLPTMQLCCSGVWGKTRSNSNPYLLSFSYDPWMGAGRKKHPSLLGCLGWHLCNPEMRRDGRKQKEVKIRFQPCSLFMSRATRFPGMCASLVSEYT